MRRLPRRTAGSLVPAAPRKPWVAAHAPLSMRQRAMTCCCRCTAVEGHDAGAIDSYSS